ncbi:hypothetical protein TUBRATIS_28640 [Tubulinosema ratisbonensis]|uniref:Uncharacterized protein n=1 Tax=Tubulinosema ratisbonensis TaxID=291195 RepID=A0A437AHX1_9MICR|nr:hypothetical protein TUBRATIS_28640 [Tubulinosema ratisbonensis]
MTVFKERLLKIITVHPLEYQKKCCIYFYEKLSIELEKEGLSIFLIHAFSDLKEINLKYNLIEKDLVLNLQAKIFEQKILHLRATILDVLRTDYYEDTKYITKPEKWIKDVCEDLKNTFDLEKDPCILLFREFNEVLLKEFQSIFISKNRKFNSCGNLLLLNFIFYENFAKKFIAFDFDTFLKSFLSNIDSRKALTMEKIRKIFINHKNK